MYKETIIPKSAKYSIDIPKEYINKKITIVLEMEDNIVTLKKKKSFALPKHRVGKISGMLTREELYSDER